LVGDRKGICPVEKPAPFIPQWFFFASHGDWGTWPDLKLYVKK